MSVSGQADMQDNTAKQLFGARAIHRDLPQHPEPHKNAVFKIKPTRNLRCKYIAQKFGSAEGHVSAFSHSINSEAWTALGCTTISFFRQEEFKQE